MKSILILTLSLAMSTTVAAQVLNTPLSPVFNIYELGIKQGKNLAYDEVAKNNIMTSVDNEKGTLGMYSIKQKANANIAYMVEIYADSDAYKKHIDSAQYKEFLRLSPEIIETNHKHKFDTTPQFLGDKKIVQDEKTINNFVIVDVKPASSQAFKDVVLPEMAQSLKVEDGVLAMYAAIDKEKSYRWYFYEIYASKAAYEAHRNTPHFKDYLKQTTNMTTYKEAVAVVPNLLMNKGELRFTAH
jgi:quinol monooxygenase YgiN